MNTVTLKGLTVEDYIHPDEKFFADKNPANFLLIRKGLDVINDLSVRLVRQITEGKWVELNRQTAPEVFYVAQTACKILDLPNLPKLFVRRERDLKITVGGTDFSQMLIPDYILNEFDLEMKLFAFGNSLAMFKGGHVRLATINSVMCGGVITAPVALAVQTYLRAADLSSDRAGLLCCQNFSAAARCIFAETGMPLTELRFLDDEEILRLTEDYLERSQLATFDLLTEKAKLLKRITGEISPPAVRLRELLNWYRGDYKQVLSRRAV